MTDNVKRLPLERNAPLPEDLRSTWDYIVEADLLGDSNMANDVRRIVRKCTLGEAVVAVRRERPDIKVMIRMPEPREKPWHELPALLVGGRPPPGVFVRLEGKARANLLELLKACGYSYRIDRDHGHVRKAHAVEPFSFAGGMWLHELARRVEGDRPGDDPIDVEPDFTVAELRDRVRKWR